MDYTPDLLRRAPDVEGPGLSASDAADRLLLDESTDARAGVTADDIVVIGDGYGALTLGVAASVASGPDARASGDADDAGTRSIRVHQDALTGERALAANAVRAGMADAFTSHPLDASLVRGARVVLLRLPRSLDALEDIAGLIAAHASPEVVVFAGGRVKHMTLAMNDVLRAHFARVDVTHARQKSRVLIARGPHAGRDPQARRADHDLPSLGAIAVCAYGGVFAGTGIDIGTRLLLEHLPDTSPGDTRDELVVDLACGTGVVAVALARRWPHTRIHASDQSAAAVASARATAAANGLPARITVVRDDLLSALPAASTSFIALNPPFHSAAAVTDAIAPRLFADARRALRSGGELWCVWNSGLRYRSALERLVGPTRQVARNAKFTVTVSTAV